MRDTSANKSTFENFWISANQIVSQTNYYGGGTYKVNSDGTYRKIDRKTGYTAGVSGIKIKLSDFNSVSSKFINFLISNKGEVVGTWKNGKNVYVDNVRFVRRKKDAVVIAAHTKQIAIFDNKRKQSFNV